jgi:surface protein
MFGYGFRQINRSILGAGGGGASEFIMTIDTTQAGSASDTFILPCGNIGVYDATIDWGDGSSSNITTYNDADLTHVYSTDGTYQIKISGQLNHIRFLSAGDRLKVISIDSWGSISWYSFQYAFSGCSNMDLLATDIPDLTTNSVTNIDQMFRNCSSLTVADLRGWDTSNVINMSLMFQNATSVTEINLTGLSTSNNLSLNQTFSGVASDTVIGLDTLNIESVTTFNNIFFSSALSTIEYDKVLVAWAGQDAVNSLSVNFGSSQYTLGSAAATSRADLISTDLWTITDGGGI